MLVKLVATLTVLVANVVICVCILLLYQLINQVNIIMSFSSSELCYFWLLRLRG